MDSRKQRRFDIAIVTAGALLLLFPPFQVRGVFTGFHFLPLARRVGGPDFGWLLLAFGLLAALVFFFRPREED